MMPLAIWVMTSSEISIEGPENKLDFISEIPTEIQTKSSADRASDPNKPVRKTKLDGVV